MLSSAADHDPLPASALPGLPLTQPQRSPAASSLKPAGPATADVPLPSWRQKENGSLSGVRTSSHASCPLLQRGISSLKEAEVTNEPAAAQRPHVTARPPAHRTPLVSRLRVRVSLLATSLSKAAAHL